MIMTMLHPGTAHILAIYSTSFYGNAKMYMQSAVCVLTTSMLSTLSWYIYTHTHTHAHSHMCAHTHTHCTHLTYLLELGKQNLAGAPGAAFRV